MPYRGIPYAVLDARYLRLDCTNDPLTAGLEINAATAGEPVLTLLTTDDNVTNPYLDLNNSGTPMPYIMEKDGTRFLHAYGTNNLFLGVNAGNFTLTGDRNVCEGFETGLSLTSGFSNWFSGYQAGRSTTTGSQNVALGSLALRDNVGGGRNLALGANALLLNVSGADNVAIGLDAFRYQTAASAGVAIGRSALERSTDHWNVGIGRSAARYKQAGQYNVFIGTFVAGQTGSGYYSSEHNVIIGASAGYNLLGGDRNIFIGYQSGYNESGSDRLYIANSNTATPLIYGEFDTWRLAFGNQYAVDKYGELAHASGFFAAIGDAQASPDSFICRRAVASHAVNTWYALYPDGGTTPERLTIAADSAWMVDVLVIGLTQNAAEQWAYQIIGVLERDNANNTTLAVQTVTTHFESDATYDAQLVADDANEALEVQVRRVAGGADYDVRWVSTIRHVQGAYS